MIRAGFLFPHHAGAWLGGVSYLRNLLGALAAVPDCGVHPVLLTQTPRPAGFEGIEVVRSVALRARHQLLARGVLRTLRWDPLDRILVHHRLDVLSHSGVPDAGSRTPALEWVPDLQHKVLPDFFSAAERGARDAAIALALCRASRILVSSEASRADMERFFPESAAKLRVLRFIDRTLATVEPTGRGELQARHGFGGRYFLLPNQYWIHKNHLLVLEALALLKQSGRSVLVLSTGSTEDHRNPGHFDALMRRRAELGVEAEYRVLGVVPHADLAGLLRGAVAVINPSLFEGWSTSVEEARSMGKRVLLSDIAVHREQAPERAAYFDPARADRLAEALWAAWTTDDPAAEESAAKRAAAALPSRQRAFAGAYASIAREVVNERRRSSAGAGASSG